MSRVTAPFRLAIKRGKDIKRIMKNKLVILGPLFFIFAVLIFAASDAKIPRLFKEAHVLYEKGNYFDSYGKLGEAFMEVWAKCPLTLRNVHFVVDEPEGFGIYTPKCYFQARREN